MSVKKLMFSSGSNYGLIYGNLEERFPTLTFSELNDIRTYNYNIVKVLLEAGTEFRMLGNRLEVYVADNTTRIKGSNITITGKSKNASKIYVYPFVPEYSVSANAAPRAFIEPRYGDTHNLSKVSILTAQQPLYETYSCILKDGGVANAVKILGTVRPEFWSEMVNGTNVFYGWTFSTLGQINTISSVDEANSLIYLTNNISASVASDTQGPNVNFGVYFKQDISEADYLQYGQPWLVANIATNLIYSVPASATGADYTLNINDCIFENALSHITLSMGNMKVNVNGDLTFKKGITPFSMFARSVSNGQTLTVAANATLTVQETGSILAGAVSISEPSGNYGAGGYLHDSIIVKSYGELHLIDNISASWRQFSGGYGPATGDFSFYETIVESGSQEYAFLMSNTMPTVINYIHATGSVLPRHDTTINSGNLTLLQNSGFDFGVGSRTINVSNVLFNGTFPIIVNSFSIANFTDCTYTLQLFTTNQVLLNTSIDECNVIGGEIVDGVGGSNPNERSRFIQANYCNQLTIEDIVVPNLNYYFLTTTIVQSPYYERTRRCIVNNVNVQSLYCVDGISIAGTVSNVLEGNNVQLTKIITQHQGKGLLANIKGANGTVSKSIVASKSYINIGLLTNVLEIDFSNTVYETSGTIEAIIAAISNNISANPQYGNNITLRAVGGDITLRTFDVATRQKSNLIGVDNTVITEGNELELTINRAHIFKTGTTNTSQGIGTGNGTTKDFKGVLGQLLLDPDQPITLVAGAINVNADADGVFNYPEVVGYVDSYTGKYQFIFTTAPAPATSIQLTYNYPNTWLNTGAWEF